MQTINPTKRKLKQPTYEHVTMKKKQKKQLLNKVGNLGTKRRHGAQRNHTKHEQHQIKSGPRRTERRAAPTERNKNQHQKGNKA